MPRHCWQIRPCFGDSILQIREETCPPRSCSNVQDPLLLRPQPECAVATAHRSVLALSPISPGARILLVGPDTEQAADTARFWGAEPTIHGYTDAEDALRLPLRYANDSFDVVEFCEGAEVTPQPGLGAVRLGEARPGWLEECARVLRPGGVLLLVVRTPKAYPISRCLEQVRDTGLEITGAWSLHPPGRAWNDLVSSGRSDEMSARRPLRSMLRRVFVWRADVPRSQSYLIRATRPGGDAPGLAIVDAILARHGGNSGAERLSCRPYSGSLTWVQGARFVKLPLNPTSRAQMRAVCELFAELEDHPISAHLPLPMQRDGVGEAEYFTTKRIDHEPAARKPDEATLEALLEKLSTGAEAIPLAESEFWARVFSPQLARPLEELFGRAAVEYLSDLAGRVVPCGLVHGDLHRLNILEQRGESFLIDWDQYERRSPRFFDVMDLSASLIHHDALGRVRQPLLDPLRTIATGSGRVPLASLLDREATFLRPEERVLLYLFHRARWRCMDDDLGTTQDREWFRRSMLWCLELLGKADRAA